MNEWRVTNDWESSDSKDEVQGVLMARQSRFLFRINPNFVLVRVLARNLLPIGE